jgi:Domain of unknown function (DUF397)
VVNPERASSLWRKSSYSAAGECVEVGSIAESVALRDSHAPSGPVLTFTPGEWTAFLGRLANHPLPAEDWKRFL